MKVRLIQDWFAPGGKYAANGQTYSGAYYTRGVHDLPAELRPFLPRLAVILDEKAEPEPVVSRETASLRDHDAERANSDAEVAIMAKAETNRLEQFRAANTKRGPQTGRSA